MWDWLTKIIDYFVRYRTWGIKDIGTRNIATGKHNLLGDGLASSSWDDIGEFLTFRLGMILKAEWVWVLIVIVVGFLAVTLFTRFYRSLFNAIK